jgi:hypothetical protein
MVVRSISSIFFGLTARDGYELVRSDVSGILIAFLGGQRAFGALRSQFLNSFAERLIGLHRQNRVLASRKEKLEKWADAALKGCLTAHKSKLNKGDLKASLGFSSQMLSQFFDVKHPGAEVVEGLDAGSPGACGGRVQERAIEMIEDGCLLLVGTTHGRVQDPHFLRSAS